MGQLFLRAIAKKTTFTISSVMSGGFYLSGHCPFAKAGWVGVVRSSLFREIFFVENSVLEIEQNH